MALGTNAAFLVVFSVFVVAFAVLAVVVVAWALRRDRAGRRAYLARRAAEDPGPPPGGDVRGGPRRGSR